MEDILTPHFGESSEGYADRVREQAAAYAANKELAKKTLSGGLKLGNTNKNSNAELTYNPKTGRLE